MKRTFAILLSLTLLISCFWLTGAAAQSQDLEDQHRSASTLKALGLLGGYTAGDDSYLSASVTRAEFVKMAVKLFNAPTGSSTVQRFLDVPADHEYAAEINEAVERGLVVGNGDSYFYPDSVITGPQAVKIALELIGYGTYAAVNGGYPTGYYVAANYAGVRVNGLDNSELTRGQGIRLLFDAVTAKQLVQTSFGENPEFQARKDVTFLSENHKIYKITGLVTSTYLTSFYGRGTVANGQTEITASEGIYILEAGKLDVDTALGCNVTAYYKENVSESTLDLLYLEPSAKNTITTVKDSDIVSFTDNAYTYYTDAQSGRTEKAKLSASAAILYNGAALQDSSGITPDFYTPSVGFVTLIDYDSDGYVDVLKISSYVNFVVGGLDKDKYIVYDKYDSNKSIILDEDASDQTVLFFDPNGSPMNFNSINEWNILSVLESKDNGKKVVKAYICPYAVRGTLRSVSDNVITVADERLTLSPDFMAQLAAAGEALRMGSEYTFYLDVMGNVAAKGEGSLSGKLYGYIITAGSEGVAGNPQVKLLTENNKISIFDLADSVIINDIAKRGDDRLNSLNRGSSYQQLVLFELNDDGKIKYIDTAAEDGEDGTLLIYYNASGAMLRYKTSIKAFGLNLYINDKTKLFQVPENGNTDEKKFKVISASYFSDNTNYAITGYSTKKMTNMASAAVVKLEGGGGSISEETPISLVERISEAVNEDGDVVKKITAMTNGNKEDALTDPELDILANTGDDAFVSIDSLNPGDIIQMSKNSEGYVTAIKRCFDYENKKNFNTNSDNDAKFYTALGTVMYKDSGIINVKTDGDAVYRYLIKGRIYLFDSESKNNKVKGGSAADILDRETVKDSASTIFIHTRYSDPQTIIIYK